jgi:polysaccharide export outer membrane protein
LFILLCCAASFSQQLVFANASKDAPSLPQHLASSVNSTAQPGGSPEAAHDPNLLVIGPGDLLVVTVFDTPELSQKARVDSDGNVELVIGGKLKLQGKLPAEAERSIEARLRDANVLRDPHVTLDVLESATQTVTVSGEVNKPGAYPWWGKKTVSELIATAGGLTQYASHTASLTHKGLQSPVRIDLDGPPQHDGDQIVLPGDFLEVVRAGTVYVLGDVGRPGGYMLDDRRPMTVLQGLALAQGLNRTACLHASLTHQMADGPQQEFLDLKKILNNQTSDPALHDGDIVYVPVNSAKDWASRGVNSILQMAVGVVIYGRY